MEKIVKKDFYSVGEKVRIRLFRGFPLDFIIQEAFFDTCTGRYGYRFCKNGEVWHDLEIEGAVIEVPNKNPRISKDEYYLSIAAAVSVRSTCLRRHYGAIIVKDDRIVSTGYNGSARGEQNCCDTGECWRKAHNIPHGEQYDKCVAVHAEENAIIQCDPKDLVGATLYLVGFEDGKEIEAIPCSMCRRVIINAQIGKVVNKNGEVKL